MAYRCPSCAYTSSMKSNLLRHVNRKTSSCHKVDEGSLKEVYEEISFPCRHEGCHTQFKHLPNRIRHEKTCRFGVQSQSNTASNNGNSDVSIQGNQNTITTTIDNSTHIDNSVHNTNNVNVTVNIQGFDDFTPEGISLQKFAKYMKDGATNVILKCLEEQQFNLENPEKMNVFISNFKDRIARVYDGCRWLARNGDDVTDKVYELYADVIDSSVDEFADDEELSTVVKKRIAGWKRNYGNDNFEKSAKDKIMFLLYNLRDIVKDMHGVKQRSSPQA